ncbi:MAG: NUDIX hydrolase [Actinomycetota bacterium]
MTAQPGPARTARRAEAPRLVRAAGALCWRRGEQGLEVLLVHRPAYDDWSWPKGKLDDDEPVPVAAVREVEEETGLTVTLGIQLPAARYRLANATDKHVTYWAAHVPVTELPPPPRPQEVDATRWFPAAEAMRRLTRRGDRQQLQALLDADAEGVLDTVPLLVLRHGNAVARDTWTGRDADRPLDDVGLRQAKLLTPLLAAWGPRRLVSSPWARCVDTVQPLADATGLKLRTKGRLSEDGHRRNPAKVARLVGKLLARREPALVCTHRPVLGTLLGTLAGNASAGVGDEIPRRDPFLDLGEVLVAHVSRRSGRVVGTERHAVEM